MTILGVNVIVETVRGRWWKERRYGQNAGNWMAVLWTGQGASVV